MKRDVLHFLLMLKMIIKGSVKNKLVQAFTGAARFG
jgi:hypothetical protein